MVSIKSKLMFFVSMLLVFMYIPATSIAADRFKIGLVNLNVAAQKSKVSKKMLEPIISEAKREKEKINRKQKRLIELDKELKKQALIMTEEERTKKEADLRFEIKSLERHIRDVEEEIEIKRRRAQKKIFQELLYIIKNIGEEEGYTLIMHNIPAQTVFYYDKSIDITDKVVRAYDKQKRKKKSSK